MQLHATEVMHIYYVTVVKMFPDGNQYTGKYWASLSSSAFSDITHLKLAVGGIFVRCKLNNATTSYGV